MDYFYQQKLINEKNQLQRQLMEANHELKQLKAIVQEMTDILGEENKSLESSNYKAGHAKPSGYAEPTGHAEPTGQKETARSEEHKANADNRRNSILRTRPRPVTEDIQIPERQAQTTREVRRLGRAATRLGKRSDAIYKKIYGVDVDKVDTVGDLGRIGFGGVDPYDTSYPDSVDDYVDAVGATDRAEARAKREREHPTKIYGLGGKIVGTKASGVGKTKSKSKSRKK